MQQKVARIHHLLADGFLLDRIESDRGAVEAHLRRGHAVAVVRIFPAEAEELLYGVPSRRRHDDVRR